MRGALVLALFGVFHAVFDRSEGCEGCILFHGRIPGSYLEWFQIGISARLRPYKLPARRRYCPRRLRAPVGFYCVRVPVRGFFCWGNPKRGVPIACARMSTLNALYLISLLSLCLGCPLQICPRPGSPLFRTFNRMFSPLLLAWTVGDVCPRFGLEQPSKTNPPKIRKTTHEKKFFSLNLLKFSEFYLEWV